MKEKNKQNNTRAQSLSTMGIAPNQLSPNEMIMRQEELFLKADRLKLERKKLNAELMVEPATPTKSDKGQMNNIDEWAEWITRNPELAEKYYPKLMQGLAERKIEPFMMALLIQKLPDHFPKWKTEADQYFGIKRAKMIQGYIDLIKRVLGIEYPSEIEQQAVESVRDELAEQLEYWENELNALTPKQGETDTAKETPTFENNFDHIAPNEIHKHFKAGLVDKGYLTEQELYEYLKAAFELKTTPQTLFKLKHTPTKQKIYNVFYEYYKDVSEKKHGTRTRYADLLGNYFKGYETSIIQTNWAKEYKTKR